MRFPNVSSLILLTVARRISSTATGARTVNLPLKNVMLFDGECNFCNGWVDLIGKFDSHDNPKIKFAPIQTPKGKEIMTLIGKSPDDLSTVVYVRHFSPLEQKEAENGNSRSQTEISPKNEVYFKSESIFRIFEDLEVLPHFVASTLLVVFPEFVRDYMYDFVARNRYNIMGKKDTCRMMNTKDL